VRIGACEVLTARGGTDREGGDCAIPPKRSLDGAPSFVAGEGTKSNCRSFAAPRKVRFVLLKEYV
jgi:hypothetical protein